VIVFAAYLGRCLTKDMRIAGIGSPACVEVMWAGCSMLKIVVPIVLIALTGLDFAAWRLSNSHDYQLFGDIYKRVETDRPVVALTLDDGPSEQFTQPVLDILAEHGLKATFFLTGAESTERPHHVAAIAAAGHEIGDHSFSHPRMVLMLPGQVAEQIEKTDEAIRVAGYEGPLHFRPPYGKKLVTLPWYLAQNNRKTTMWDVEPEVGAVDASADELAQKAIDQVQNGSIIIMHVMYQSRQNSRDALPKMIEGLKARGFEFVTVSELLALAR
jgi:peptidoglycan/xylan/chitin deacetylase (PgdA/CDA1 family)